MDKKKIDLNGQWQLFYAPEEQWTPGEFAFPDNAPCIAAAVPGNVELDLFNAGIEPDPFYGQNLYAYRKYEFYAWKYVRTFDVPQDFAPEEAVLCFGGINTYASIYLNGSLIGTSDNMLVDREYATDPYLKRGETNTLEVLIRSAANVAREKDYSVSLFGNDDHEEYVWQRKPAHSFGWDIMPRFPSAGLWRGVSLIARSRTRFTQSYYATTDVYPDGSADLLCKWRFTTPDGSLCGYKVRLEGNWVSSGYEIDERRFETESDALFTAGEFRIHIPDAKLWWPRGYGNANLYETELMLLKDDKVVDLKRETIGIRKAELIRNMAAGDAGEFRISVNNTDIFAKGTNWVPLDAFHSRDNDRLAKAHALLCDLGCNIVRCWGGNVYEDHAFFDLCDREGILVWQDFAMACASYPQEQAFFDTISAEADAVIRKLRNHASLFIWAGDNEVDAGLSGRKLPQGSRYNAITREILPQAVRRNDPYRDFLPSSPYIDNGIAETDVPEQHTWGARAYYKGDFYKHNQAHFISECGYHGCPAVDSLRKFIPEESLNDRQSDDWRVHNTEYTPSSRGYDRNQLMTDQVQILFGEVPADLNEYAYLSQCSQAEAKKYFIERARIGKWRCTGIIWWNLLDGWPQISDAVVDYYFEKKRAYACIRRSQQPIVLIMDELRDWTHDVYLCNDSLYVGPVRWRITDADSGRILRAGMSNIKANENTLIATIRAIPGEKKLYLLRCECGGEVFENHYIDGYPPFDRIKMHSWTNKIDQLKG